MNRLVLELIADQSQLLKSMEQSQKSINNFVRSADAAGTQLGSVNRVMSSFTGLASGGAIAAGVLAGAMIATATAGVTLALAAGRQAEEIEQLSSITGVSSDTMQDYEAILHRVGLGGDDLVRVFKTLSTKLEEARAGAGPASDRFRQLGIDIKSVTSTEDLIKKVSTSLSQFSNGTAKAAIETDLFGKSGLKFGLALEEMAKSSANANRETINLGATLSSGQLAELSAMDDRVDDLGTAWNRFAQQLSSFVAPAVDFAARALTNLLAMASDGLKAMNSLAGISAGKDTRSSAPPLVDQGKVLERARAQADGLLKIMDSQLKQENAYEQARAQLAIAGVERLGSIELSGQFEIAKEQERIRSESATKVIANLQAELEAFDAFFAKKKGMYGTDEKVLADKLKFEQDSQVKRGELLNQIDLAEMKSNQERMAGAQKLFDLGQQLSLQSYQDEVTHLKAIDENQRTLFQSESSMLGASDAARRVRMNLIEAEAALSRATIDANIQDETRRAQALENLDIEVDTKRRQTIQQFPSFFEQQMQAIVASNVFSMGSMVSTWTSGIAQMVVHGGNLQAVWEQTQVALVQAVLNAGVQQVAQAGIAIAQRIALETTGAATEVSINAAKNASLIAADTATASAREAIAAGEAPTSLGFFATVGAGAKAMFVETILPAIIAVGEWIMSVLGAIASALSATVFGIPFAGAILVGIGLIAGALALSGNLGFAKGGIGDFGSGTPATLHGQEAIIPLNSRGADFMRDAMGGTGGGNMTVVMQVDGREMARKTLQYMPGIVYMKTGMA